MNKKCGSCKAHKSIADFWKDKSKKDGLCSECKICKHAINERHRKANPAAHNKRCIEWGKKNRPKMAKILKEWREKNPDKRRASALKYKLKHPDRYKRQWTNRKLKKYGISMSQYNAILESQKGLCKICKTNNPGKGKSWAIDHCHTTGKVRGLLCLHCNFGLGSFRDNPEILKTAISYLKEGIAKDVL